MNENRRQFRLDGNKLVLIVKKSPLIIRLGLFLFAFLSFGLPVSGVVYSVINGSEPRLTMVFGIIVFGLMGFYLLRHALWNSYGKEELEFSDKTIVYRACYGWFTDSEKRLEYDDLSFSMRVLGYEESGEGALTINYGDQVHHCVTRMRNSDIERLINALEKSLGLIEHF